MERISSFVASVPAFISIALVVALATGAHFVGVYVTVHLNAVVQALR